MRIGFATQNIRSHYWLTLSYAVRERAAALGIDIDILPSSTIEEQIAAIDTLVQQRVHALLIGPQAAHGLAPTLRRVRAAGIPIFVAATDISDYQATCTVRPDNSKGAQQAAAFLADRLITGKVALLIGPTHMHDNIDRAAGIRDALARYPGIQIVAEQESPDWEPKHTADLLRAILQQHPDLRGVCTTNDQLALGALI